MWICSAKITITIRKLQLDLKITLKGGSAQLYPAGWDVELAHGAGEPFFKMYQNQLKIQEYLKSRQAFL